MTFDSICQELQGLVIDRADHFALFGRDVVSDHSALWQVLEDLEWAAVNDGRVSITGDGVFYLPLIQNFLAHDRTEAMRHRRHTVQLDTLSHTSVEA